MLKQKTPLVGIAFLFAIFFTSCQTSKDLAYLTDLLKDEEIIGHPGIAPEYKLKPDDNLYVALQSNNQKVNDQFKVTDDGGNYSVNKFSNEAGQYIYGYMLDKEGSITLPILGVINLGGLTMAEANDAIQAKADEYLKDSNIQVKLLSFKVTVMGEVKAPGVYTNYSESFTILEAISRAKGISDYASIRNVRLIRKTPEGVKTFELDLSSKEIFASDCYYLKSNDVLYIEPAKYKSVSLNAQTFSLALSTISMLIAVVSAL